MATKAPIGEQRPPSQRRRTSGRRRHQQGIQAPCAAKQTQFHDSVWTNSVQFGGSVAILFTVHGKMVHHQWIAGSKEGTGSKFVKQLSKLSFGVYVSY